MIATGAARARPAMTLPRDRTIGLLLAAGTAAISGIAVFLNASAVKAVQDPAVFTTLKNLVAVVLLVVVAAAAVRPSEVRGIGRADRLTLTVIGILGGGIAFLLLHDAHQVHDAVFSDDFDVDRIELARIHETRLHFRRNVRIVRAR